MTRGEGPHVPFPHPPLPISFIFFFPRAMPGFCRHRAAYESFNSDNESWYPEILASTHPNGVWEQVVVCQVGPAGTTCTRADKLSSPIMSVGLGFVSPTRNKVTLQSQPHTFGPQRYYSWHHEDKMKEHDDGLATHITDRGGFISWYPGAPRPVHLFVLTLFFGSKWSGPTMDCYCFVYFQTTCVVEWTLDAACFVSLLQPLENIPTNAMSGCQISSTK